MTMTFALQIVRRVALSLTTIVSTIAVASDIPADTRRSTLQQQEPLVMRRSTVASLALPSSQYELWQRILRLLAEDGGFTPKDRVEAMLGISFTETRRETDPPTLGVEYVHRFQMKTDGLGDFDVTLFDDPTHTSLSVKWGRILCLDIHSAMQDLFRLGWAGGVRNDIPPWRPVRVSFYLAEEVAFVAAHDLHPGTKELLQRLSNLTLWSSQGHKSDCMNSFSSDIWRTPLHRQPINAVQGE